jgi:DNA invertase Pin-like site-specific DNA recombinase
MPEVQIIKASEGKVNRRTGKIIQKLRVAAYCRVSTDSDEQLNSYNSQVTHYTDLIQKNEAWEFVNVYADFGISGTQTKKRTEFQRMIKDAKSGLIDMIITKSISRFARNTIDTLEHVRELKELGVAVTFEKENINTLTSNGELLLTILSSLAQGESESISQNTKMGLKMKAKQGEMIGFNSCLGYTYDTETGKLIINEEEARTVKYIFRRYIEGVGAHTISKELETMGIHTKKGKVNWNDSVLAGIIRNEKYMGDVVMGKTYTVDPISKKRIVNFGEQDRYYIKNHHEPIVSREVFNTAQEIRKKRSRRTNDGIMKKHSMEYPFSNVMKCKYCGGTIIRRKWTSGAEPKFVWYCHHAAKKGKKVCPHSKAIPEKVMEQSFVRAFNALCKDNEKIIEEFLENLSKSLEYREHEKEQRNLNDKINKLNNQRNQLVDLLLEQKINKEIYNRKYEKVSTEIEVAEQELQAYNDNNEFGDDFSSRLTSFKRIFEKKELMDKFDGEIFRTLVKEVFIGDNAEDGKPLPYTINFVFKTGLKINILPLFPKEPPPENDHARRRDNFDDKVWLGG